MITHFVIHGEKPTQEALWKASFFLCLDDDDDEDEDDDDDADDDDDDDDDTDKSRISLS